jgi:hypothetical protein
MNENWDSEFKPVKKKNIKESVLTSVMLPITIFALKYIAERGFKNVMKDIASKLGKTYDDIKFNLSRIGRFVTELHKSKEVTKDLANILHSVHKGDNGLNYSEVKEITDRLMKSQSVINLVKNYKIQQNELNIVMDELKTFMRSSDFNKFAKEKLSSVNENLTGYESSRGQGYDYKGQAIKNLSTDIGKSGESMLDPKILDISDEDSSYDPINAGDYDELNYSSPIYMNPNI